VSPYGDRAAHVDNAFGIFVPGNSSIKTVPDLKGKTFALPCPFWWRVREFSPRPGEMTVPVLAACATSGNRWSAASGIGPSDLQQLDAISQGLRHLVKPALDI
jgi:ABC-type nitrate/sulfonate/bicarbonate transport system substrate-binding protein